MHRTRSAMLTASLFVPLLLHGQVSTPEITAGELTGHVKYLASDELEGRGSGSAGNQKAAAYVADLLRKYGLQPAGDNGTYFQQFPFVSAIKLGPSNALGLEGPGVQGGRTTFTVDKDFRPFGFTSNSTLTAPLVFAGYGISSPDNNYDDFKDIDVKDKIVVALRYSPDGNDPHNELNRVSSLRNKARTVRDKGGAGLIMVSGPNDEQEDDLVKLSFDQAFASSGLPVVSATRAAVEPLFRARGWSLKAIQDSIKATKKPIAFEFTGTTATLTTDVAKVYGKTANVVGFLPGNDPALKGQVMVLGAHLDHLGFGGQGSGSLKPDTIAIHRGADDNASGTAGLLELAQAFAAQKATLKRGLVFTFFSGEELGTLGSGYYVNNPLFPLAQTTAMVNLDMIGRLENRTLTVYGTGTSPLWNGLLAKYNSDSAFTLKLVPDGFGPSDHSQFYGKDIPVLFFFTGTHNDYHKPSDTWDRINYPGQEKVVRYVYRIVNDVNGQSERPLFAKAASAPPAGGGDSRGFRVTLGIVPDYAEGSDGMKIGGIRPGGPAEKAGLKSGDVIVRMASKKVMNVYDYMGMLGELKAGDKVAVEVLRDGKTMTFTAEMEKRK